MRARTRVFCYIPGRNFVLGGIEVVGIIEGTMPRAKPRYRVTDANLDTREQLKIELVDLPFSNRRTFRLRVNGRWAQKVPVGSTTRVLRQLRSR